MRVGLFTEIYRPVINGVVASVEALASGLQSSGHEVFCFAPSMPGTARFEGGVHRIPSLPLPVRTPYRLTLPLVSRRVNAVIKKLSLIHAHSPFVTGWLGLRIGRADIAQTSATKRKFATSELPPYDMNGSVMPVSGKTPITPPTMMNT